MQEKDIKEGINSPLFFPYSDRPKEFIVYKVNNFWNVKFTFREKSDCKLRLKCRDKSDKIVTKDFVSIKTAFFASDPNLGRILAAIGYAGIDDLDVDKLDLYLGDVLVAEKGGRAASYQESQGSAVMKESDILVRVVLNRGAENVTIWTCDFSYDYVKINADYRS